MTFFRPSLAQKYPSSKTTFCLALLLFLLLDFYELKSSNVNKTMAKETSE